MERTPERPLPAEPATFPISEDDDTARPPPRRLKKPPPITPRRFEKFFAPRLAKATNAVRTSRAALLDITGPALNRRKGVPRIKIDLPTIGEQPASKKRKLSFTSQISSLQSSPIKGPALPSDSQKDADTRSRFREEVDYELSDLNGSDIGEEDETDIEEVVPQEPKAKIRSYRTFVTSTSLLSSRLSGRRAKREVEGSSAWQHSAANFYSGSGDVYSSTSNSSGFLSLPFSVASCNTNSLIAVGNEDGNIQLVDAAIGDKNGFSRTYLTMKPHDNAIMDLEFSSDDALLATGSGDQTSQIIDVQTQTSLYCLSGHSSSIKRVQFQPGSGSNVIATCSRDGCINIWDLRCRTVDRPSFHLRRSPRSPTDAMTTGMRYSSLINAIRRAHATPNCKPVKPDQRAKPNHVAGRDDFSVTSLSFLGAGRSHLIATASEVDAVVKLWDLRTTYNGRRARAPVSCTEEPKSHEVHRRFGLTSLALSGDGARLYTLCRDHTVYTYATSHLILGNAPEMSRSTSHSSRQRESSEQGLRPLYGFRHPRLRIATFYPKLAIRRASRSDTELLAVGSSEDCAIIFPTDERYLTKTTQTRPPLSTSAADPRPGLARQDSSFNSLREASDYSPHIYYHGTPLERGHTKEVTAVTWTTEGSLVTASDDFTTRCWREDATRARELRTGGNWDGGQWGAGWADVPAAYDEEE